MTDSLLSETDAWARLVDASHAKAAPWTISDVCACGLALDVTRHPWSSAVRDAMRAVIEARDVMGQRDAMMRGDIVNKTEGRAAVHTAMRQQDSTPCMVRGHNIIPDVRDTQANMRALTESFRQGLRRGVTGKPLTRVLSIGIGGSDLGPRLVVDALALPHDPPVYFLSNVDGRAVHDAITAMDPETTQLVVISKTFTTQETCMDRDAVVGWMAGACGATHDQILARHAIAVTAAPHQAQAAGFMPESILTFPEDVGGRFSVWSAVGLPVALACGWDVFQNLLRGAAAMDHHFATAPFDTNMPMLLGMLHLWQRNILHTPTLAVIPYVERLRLFHAWLQQLEMESNGKSVTHGGVPMDMPTAPAVFGGTGTCVQHSFHQWLHQGTDAAMVDMIGVDAPHPDWPTHHHTLMTHRRAQADVLWHGCDAETLRREGGDDSSLPHRVHAGRRGVSLITMDTLDAFHLGALMALYEHKVVTQGWVWGINSFDQWGVERGKVIQKLYAQS